MSSESVRNWAEALAVIIDPTARDDFKLKAAQGIAEDLEVNFRYN